MAAHDIRDMYALIIEYLDFAFEWSPETLSLQQLDRMHPGVPGFAQEDRPIGRRRGHVQHRHS